MHHRVHSLMGAMITRAGAGGSKGLNGCTLVSVICRISGYLPFGIVPLQFRHLHLVTGAYPFARKRVAEAEGMEHERGHTSILAGRAWRR